MTDDSARHLAEDAGAADAAAAEPALADEDLAAEPDADDPSADGGEPDDEDDEDDEDDDQTGVCRGGPYNGRAVYCRYPQGFLLVHRQRNLVWIYDAASGGEYVARGAPLLLDDEKRWQTLDEGAYDVIAYDDGPVPG